VASEVRPSTFEQDVRLSGREAKHVGFTIDQYVIDDHGGDNRGAGLGAHSRSLEPLTPPFEWAIS
jgi:hypothetical protein